MAQRQADGRVNRAPAGTSRTVGQIVFANVFNPVNAIMLTLFVVILIAGYPADGLFVGVVASNTVIGIAQELYARRKLRSLQVLNAPRARVRRDGADAGHRHRRRSSPTTSCCWPRAIRWSSTARSCGPTASRSTSRC